ncbi:hypothetical protein GCM10007884_36240 [Methylobacterium brachythecii]|uniref:Uncharacterized protein n=1 Tax=Methylobacterium brachythecii TaxID=1176177 RepID=A0ABQ6D7V5_9HYPH|nr:hypothetical protein GCM10007884_36240 [Methylobacterium brachythecii]
MGDRLEPAADGQTGLGIALAREGHTRRIIGRPSLALSRWALHDSQTLAASCETQALSDLST